MRFQEKLISCIFLIQVLLISGCAQHVVKNQIPVSFGDVPGAGHQKEPLIRVLIQENSSEAIIFCEHSMELDYVALKSAHKSIPGQKKYLVKSDANSLILTDNETGNQIIGSAIKLRIKPVSGCVSIDDRMFRGTIEFLIKDNNKNTEEKPYETVQTLFVINELGLEDYLKVVIPF
jgi:hypothetical protein